MAKYRDLTLEELQELEKEFVDFLVLNGIDSEDWVNIKKEKSEKAEGIISAFSDVVFQKILMQCRYIEKYTSRSITAIFCDKNKMHLQRIELPEDAPYDLLNKEDFEKLKTEVDVELEYSKGEKEYAGDRELEIYKMLESGFIISNQKLYMSLFEE